MFDSHEVRRVRGRSATIEAGGRLTHHCRVIKFKQIYDLYTQYIFCIDVVTVVFYAAPTMQLSDAGSRVSENVKWERVAAHSLQLFTPRVARHVNL